MSGRRLKSEGLMAWPWTPSGIQAEKRPQRGGSTEAAVWSVSKIDIGQGAKPEMVPNQIEEKPDQYRATITIATISNAAISESARSSFLDRDTTPASSGGITLVSLRRRLQFAGKPAAHIGLHRILRYAHRVNMAAFLALKRA
jgi:hypothetical protein